MNNDSQKEITLKILEEHYKTIKKQSDTWNFFLNTAEYTKFIQNNRNLTESIRKLTEQQKQAYEIFQGIDNGAIQELKNAFKTISGDIEKAKVNIGSVNKIVAEFQQYNVGSILSSVPKAHALDGYLFNIAKNLKLNGFNNLVKKFEDESKEIKNIYGNFTFSRSLSLRDKAEEELEKKRKIEMWGAWEDLPLIQRIILDDENLETELREISEKDKAKRWDLFNYLGVRGELKHIQDEDKSEEDLVFFKVSDFKNKVDRIHKYLVTELLSDTKEEQNYCSFDEANSVLSVNGQKVKFRKFTEQYHTLRIIFADSNEIDKEWFFSDIGERLDDQKGYKDKDFHNYISAIKRKMGAETGIQDFFITTNQSVRINKKYLR